MIDQTILDEAANIVTGDKSQKYGHPTINFERIAAGWQIIFADGIDDEKVALAMVWLKMCRQLQSPKRDNIVDAIGYLLTLDVVYREKHFPWAEPDDQDKPWQFWKIDRIEKR